MALHPGCACTFSQGPKAISGETPDCGCCKETSYRFKFEEFLMHCTSCAYPCRPRYSLCCRQTGTCGVRKSGRRSKLQNYPYQHQLGMGSRNCHPNYGSAAAWPMEDTISLHDAYACALCRLLARATLFLFLFLFVNAAPLKLKMLHFSPPSHS